jgi:hypothetical protein
LPWSEIYRLNADDCERWAGRLADRDRKKLELRKAAEWRRRARLERVREGRNQ